MRSEKTEKASPPRLEGTKRRGLKVQGWRGWVGQVEGRLEAYKMRIRSRPGWGQVKGGRRGIGERGRGGYGDKREDLRCYTQARLECPEQETVSYCLQWVCSTTNRTCSTVMGSVSLQSVNGYNKFCLEQKARLNRDVL